MLVLVSSIIFVDAMLFTALTPLIPDYADEFDLSKLGAGILVGSFGAGAVFGGVPGGIAAARFGPKWAVVAGLVLLGVASFAFALADSASTLSAARFVQGFASTTTWAGALSWVAMEAPKDRRGAMLGTAFGTAVFGAMLGPAFGGVADLAGVRASFLTVGVVVLAFAAFAAMEGSTSRAEAVSGDGLRHALRDKRFLGGLWLNTLPAFLFGMLVVLVPLALDDAGWSTPAIAAVFVVSFTLEAALNPLLGRLSDRIGSLRPVRFALVGSAFVSAFLAAASYPILLAGLVVVAGVAFGAFYAPGMALASRRADVAGLAQGLAFGIVNSSWALGQLSGPLIGGGLADAFDDSVPYLLGSVACLATLAATMRLAPRKARVRAA